MRRSLFFPAVLIALLLSGLGSAALAQSNRGSIGGTIVDATGAGIANAKITARETATGVVTEATSTGEGNYRLPELPVGVYTLTVTAQGFKTSEQTDVKVDVNTARSLDISLEPGAVTETVTVASDVLTVQAETSEVGTVVQTRQVLELPVLPNGGFGLRSAEAFVFLAPGTVGPGTAGQGNGGTFQSKITGSQNFSNEVLVDGASIFRSENGSSFDETAPSVEAVTEFKVTTSTLNAEFGRTGGGITSFVIKSGTNDYHGSLYDVLRNRVLNANGYFNNFNGIQRPLDTSNDFGGTVGGPIFFPRFGEGGKAVYNGKNRSFFFFSYEGFRRTSGGPGINTVPTGEFLRGDFSALLDPTRSGNSRAGQVIGTDALGRNILVGQIYDPATTRTVNGQIVRDPFPGNVIPRARFSSVASNVLGFFPIPTNSNRFQNFIFGQSSPFNIDAYTFKIDHSFSDRSKISGSFTKRANNRIVGTQTLPTPLEPDARNQTFTTYYYRLAHDYTLSPNLLNHLNLGVNRTISFNQAFGAGTFSPGQIGLSGIDSPLFPSFSFGGGIRNIGNGTNNVNTDNGFRANDSVSYIRGNHSIKIGGDFRYQQYTPTAQNGTAGNFGFGNNQTAVNPNFTSDTGFGFASFLLGQVGGATLNISPAINQWRSNYYAGFVQDDYKIRKNLTLNLGFRYEVETPRRELHDRTSSFVATLPNPAAGGRLGALGFAGDGAGRVGTRTFAKTYYKDFGPRVGFAYSPDRFKGVLGKALGGSGKTVIRGGYGIYYEALVYADFGERLAAGFRGDANFSSVNNFDPAFNLDQGFPQNFPRPPFIDPTIRNNSDVEFLSPEHGQPPRIQNYSLEVQRQLGADLVLSVAYVGANAHHLHSNLLHVNDLNPKYNSLGNLLNADINSPEARAANIPIPYAGFNGPVERALRPYPQYNFINTDCCLENAGNSTYNSLQVKLERRFSQGLSLLTSYTFSKTLTDSDSALPIFATFSGGGSVQNPYDRHSEKALSNQDIPHTLVISYIYELPIGEGKRFDSGNKVINKVIGGFQVGAVHRYQSGQPISFGCAGGIPGSTGCIRFDRVQGQPLTSEAVRNGTFDPTSPDPTKNRYFNRAAFRDPNTPCLGNDRAQGPTGCRLPTDPFRFGTMARTTSEVRSRPYFDESINILKKTRITEAVAAEFRAEFFNVFNRVVFDRPNTDVNGGDFGRVFNTNNNARTIQFQLRFLF